MGRHCAAVSLPEIFNAATYFVDRNVEEGRGGKVAIECGGERVTYRQVLERVNRVGSALREQPGVGREERVWLLMLDGPEMAYGFPLKSASCSGDFGVDFGG